MFNKTCNKCGESKDSTSYDRDSRNKNGLQGICHECRKKAKNASRALRLTGVGLKPAETKQCNKCGESKSSQDFYRDAGIQDGRATICKLCKNKNTDQWRVDNREKYNSDMSAYRKKNYKRMRLYRYKMTLEMHNDLLKRQNYQCALCHKTESRSRPLAVDHNHTTGKIRGLLCFGCNRALYTLEKEGFLEKAQAYLIHFKE